MAKGVGGSKKANLAWRNYWTAPCVIDMVRVMTRVPRCSKCWRKSQRSWFRVLLHRPQSRGAWVTFLEKIDLSDRSAVPVLARVMAIHKNYFDPIIIDWVNFRFSVENAYKYPPSELLAPLSKETQRHHWPCMHIKLTELYKHAIELLYFLERAPGVLI